jgi:inner membrane transporter RhtA
VPWTSIRRRFSRICPSRSIVGPLGIAALRLGFSALLLLAVFRPHIRGHERRSWAIIEGIGTALAGMNGLFYEALARLPLGTAVTLELLGPLVLFVVMSQRLAGWLWAAAALGGVVLLGWRGNRWNGFGAGPGPHVGGIHTAVRGGR